MDRHPVVTPGLATLGDPTRGRIVSLLLDAPDHAATVGVLTAQLGLRQPTVSHHLKLMHAAGVLDRVPRGRSVWYSLRADVVARLGEWKGPSAAESREPALLDTIVRDLEVRFAGTVSAETVRELVLDSARRLDDRGAERAAPSAIAQFAADRIAAIETASAGLTPGSQGRPLELLFVCVQNAGRSQLAAAIARHLGGDRVRVRTAGSAPVGSVRPAVITALDEIGVPLGGEYPKPLTDDVVRAADIVVTMGCGDACPVFPGRRYLDWAVDDPAAQPMDRVRAIRDDVDARVRALLGELGVMAPVA